MDSIVIRVENLSKLYRLGQVGTGSIAHDVNRWWHLIRGKEDPYTRVGELNDRESKGDSEYVWALNDVSFDIQAGEVVGIIGRNGAGKSTLLKILSRVTRPTRGIIKAKGRIASLLEVGTGFHPELTGRENIFLNGAILGMRKREIASKFDEIIDFSGCERYVDTPVKRYSSGMYVRLAFAVAAHLEPEIMIIDEVLAVGDGDFQKKCLGKMHSMHQQGRTVIIVSHQMSMITSLCDRGIVVRSGGIAFIGPAAEAVAHYQRYGASSTELGVFDAAALGRRIGDDRAELHRVWCSNSRSAPRHAFDLAEEIHLHIEYSLLKPLIKLAYPNFHLFDEKGEYVFCVCPTRSQLCGHSRSPGRYVADCIIPAQLLNAGNYTLGVAVTCMDPGVNVSFFERDSISFQVVEDMDVTLDETRHGYAGTWPGPVRPTLDWKVEACN